MLALERENSFVEEIKEPDFVSTKNEVVGPTIMKTQIENLSEDDEEFDKYMSGQKGTALMANDSNSVHEHPMDDDILEPQEATSVGNVSSACGDDHEDNNSMLSHNSFLSAKFNSKVDTKAAQKKLPLAVQPAAVNTASEEFDQLWHGILEEQAPQALEFD